MKVALLTSENLRHKYIAAALARELDLPLIISEAKSKAIKDTSSLTAKDATFIKNHFNLREEGEKNFFGAFEEFTKCHELLKIAHGNINHDYIFEKIKETNPDFLVLFGTSIIRNPLLNYFDGRIINLHLGLSPYYRGSATNIFPYYYDEPECVGATIHLATSKVDAGAVLYQFRPNIEPEDDLHSIGNKTIWKAGKILPAVLKAYYENKLFPVTQIGQGKNCRNKELSPLILRDIYSKFDSGMIIKNYLLEKNLRDLNKPIINPYLNF